MKKGKIIALMLAALQVNLMAVSLPVTSTANYQSVDSPINKTKDYDQKQDNNEEIVSTNSHETTVKRTEPLVKKIGIQTITVDLSGNGIFLEGKRVSASAKCYIKDNISYVPLKTIVSDIYGGSIVYNKVTKEVKGSIDGLEFTYTMNSKHGYKNGVYTVLTLPMIVENGIVYCPIKSLEDLFDMKMSYNVQNKRIMLTAPDRYEPEVITTFADFSFNEESYIQGQLPKVADESYDIDENAIIDRSWMLDNNQHKISQDLTSLFKDIAPGYHTVSLRVKNSNGKWSEWETKSIFIEENKKPEVTEIKSSKDKYAQGEKIELDYTYINEEWEEITNEKWSYKLIGEEDKSKVYQKPEYIFYEGDFEVGLQVQDQFGNWSENYTFTLHITDEVKDTELNYKFNMKQPGIIIDNFEKRNYRDFEQVEMTKIGSDGGTYILSDSPEIVSQNGILYEDYIEGKGRINFHHINNYQTDAKKRKLVVMAENVTSEPVTITLYDKIIRGPSIDALYVGQLLLYQYFRGNGHAYYVLQPGEKIFLINTEDKNWDTNMLIAAQMDLHTNGKVKFTVASMDKGMTTASMSYLPYLPTDNHPRGTFEETELYYEVTAAGDKETYFVVGTGKEEWSVGMDAIKNTEVLNAGNYGIVYHIKITAEEDMGIILNPRGGPYRGAIRINGVYTYMMPYSNYIGTDSYKAAVVTTIKKGETVELEYSLPNGSAAPILFGMIPKTFWTKK